MLADVDFWVFCAAILVVGFVIIGILAICDAVENIEQKKAMKALAEAAENERQLTLQLQQHDKAPGGGTCCEVSSAIRGQCAKQLVVVAKKDAEREIGIRQGRQIPQRD